MKRIFLSLVLLAFSLSACTSSTPTPAVDVAPTAAQEAVQPTAVKAVESTAAPTQVEAQMPPLKSIGWKRVTAKMPFTFELPDGWNTPEGFLPGAPYWTPDGVIKVNGLPILAVNEFDLGSVQNAQTWPQNSAVQSRETVLVKGVGYEMVKVIVYNGEGGTPNAYETHVVIPMPGLNKLYGVYVSSATAEGRPALDEILVHAVQSLEFN